MKKKGFILILFIMFLGFSFILNVKAEEVLPKITRTSNTLSTQIRVEYELSSCKYSKCGIIILNRNWVYKNNEAMILRPSTGAGYKVYDGLNKGEVYKFAVAYYWFDDNGAYHNSAWSWSDEIKAEAPADKVPTNLEILDKPLKTKYIEGEMFDPEGMNIRVTYNTGDPVEIKDGAGCSFMPSKMEKDTTMVKVTCEGLSVNQIVEVKEKEIEEITEVVSEPNKTTYIDGELFDPEGMVIKVKYDNGLVEDLNVTEDICQFNPEVLTTLNDKVTVTCSNISVDQSVTVVDKYITSLTKKTPATKTIYEEGEIFDPEGMEVDATYSDNSEKTLNIKEEIANGTCTLSPNTELTKDVASVKITCTNNIEIIQEITVKEMVTVNVIVKNGTVNSPSKKAQYNSNFVFDIVPNGDDYIESFVNCTNEQTGTYENNVLTLNNVTKSTTCTVKLVNEMTSLYEDGTLIINEQLKDRSSNIEKHGLVTNSYNAMDDDNSYVFDADDSGKINSPWDNERENVKSVEIGKVIKPTSTAYWFYEFRNMRKGDFSNLDTSEVTDMNHMFTFAGYSVSIFNLDLSGWDTSKVTDMGGMFNRTGVRSEIWDIGDISGWDTSNVTNMRNMFYYTGQNAKTFSLNLSNWDTSKVTDMGYMFAHSGYYATTFNLDIPGWDTSNVTNMNNMFQLAGNDATTWTVKIPTTTGTLTNTTSKWYGSSESVYADPCEGKTFTLA